MRKRAGRLLPLAAAVGLVLAAPPVLAHEDGASPSHGRLTPNDGSLAAGVNGAVWQDDAGVPTPAASVAAQIEPASALLALWMLSGGGWMYHIPAAPGSSTLSAVPPVASLLLVIGAGGATVAVPPPGDDSPPPDDALLPDLVPMPASELRFQTQSSGRVLLRFTTTSLNRGAGPLEVRARAAASFDLSQDVDQRIYRADGTFFERNAGAFTLHPLHKHFHFDDYGLYTLESVDDPEGARISEKTTSCFVDTKLTERGLPNAPAQRVYQRCDVGVQGLSVGWVDIYAWNLPGQEFDVTGLSPGRYRIVIQLDPKGLLMESDTTNNTSTFEFDLNVGARTITPVAGPAPGATPAPTATPPPLF